MHSPARIVHQTRDRMRLRMPARRRDISYFLDLYEDLRQIPGVTDVVINPRTASVLLHFPGASDEPVCSSLRQLGLLAHDESDSSSQPVVSQVEHLSADNGSGTTQVRSVLVAIMIGLAIHQIRQGKIFAPVLSLLWFAYDQVAAHKKEKALLETIPQTPSDDSEPEHPE